VQSPERAGAIYDIGYRRYGGQRLGRAEIVTALFLQGLRSAFGLGRRPAAKIAPFGLAALALIPATIYLGIAALAPADLDLVATEDYLGIIFTILILFVGAVGPDLVGRDLRYRTLSLYFTRPLERDDYVAARLAALAAAALAVTLLPQAVLITGNALAASSAWGYLRDEWAEIPRVIVSGAIAAAYAASLGIAVGCHTHRRSLAIGGVVGTFVVASAVGNILADTVGGPWLLLAPSQQLRAATLLVFGRKPDIDEPLGEHDLPLVSGALVMAGVVAACLAITLRRYRQVPA
jgi:ABC-2 type transport system permease protein